MKVSLPLHSVLSALYQSVIVQCGLGRTIPSFKIAAEMERVNWRAFRSLLNRKDRKMFDEMFSYVRLYNSAGTMAARPFVFHSVLISLLFQHYKQLKQLTDLKNKLTPYDWKIPEAKQIPNTTLDRYYPELSR